MEQDIFNPPHVIVKTEYGRLEQVLRSSQVSMSNRAGPGSAAVVPPNMRHSVSALSDGRAIVVDHPVRDSVGGVRID